MAESLKNLLRFAGRAAAAALVLTLVSGCGINPFNKKNESVGMNTSVSGVRRVSGNRQAAGAARAHALTRTAGREYNPGSATGTVTANNGKEKTADLIKESGFDMIYPNFNKDTGRQDPFVPVSLSAGPLEQIREMSPEKFRVIGTAMTPTGQIAMIEVGEQTKIVREGDVLESGHVVKTITRYDVLLDKEGRQIRLTMFTRQRIARSAEQQNVPKLPGLNMNDLYVDYLKSKYSEEVEGHEGETAHPNTFSDYLNTREKDLATKAINEEPTKLQ